MDKHFILFSRKLLKGAFASLLFCYRALSVFLGSLVWAFGVFIKIKIKQSLYVDRKSLPWWFFHFAVMAFIVGFLPWYIWYGFFNVGYN